MPGSTRCGRSQGGESLLRTLLPGANVRSASQQSLNGDVKTDGSLPTPHRGPRRVSVNERMIILNNHVEQKETGHCTFVAFLCRSRTKQSVDTKENVTNSAGRRFFITCKSIINITNTRSRFSRRWPMSSRATVSPTLSPRATFPTCCSRARNSLAALRSLQLLRSDHITL